MNDLSEIGSSAADLPSNGDAENQLPLAGVPLPQSVIAERVAVVEKRIVRFSGQSVEVNIDAINTSYDNSIASVAKAGERWIALKAKKSVKHGDWQALLEAQGVSDRTVSDHMRLARELPTLPNKQPNGKPWSIRKALAERRVTKIAISDDSAAPPATMILGPSSAAVDVIAVFDSHLENMTDGPTRDAALRVLATQVKSEMSDKTESKKPAVKTYEEKVAAAGKGIRSHLEDMVANGNDIDLVTVRNSALKLRDDEVKKLQEWKP